MKVYVWNFIFLILIFMDSKHQAQAAEKIAPEIKRILDYQWGMNYETSLKKAGMILPRILGHFSYYLIYSQTGIRIANFFKLPFDWTEGNVRKSYVRLNNSIANPLSSVNSAVSDVASTIKSPLYSTSRLSSRIKVCTSSLSDVYLVDPTHHIRISIDNEDISDRGLDHPEICQAVPIIRNNSESVAIQRLTCVSRKLWVALDPFTYNCGAQSRDRLRFSGLGFPIFPNLGIGSALSWVSKENIYTKPCDEEIASLKETFESLEKGIPIASPQDGYGLSNDVVLQLFISAARGKDIKNRLYVLNLTKHHQFEQMRKTYVDVLGRKVKGMLKNMFIKLDQDAQTWLEQANPEIFSLFQMQMHNHPH